MLVRADFSGYNDRTADARALLNHVLQDDPNNVLAHEPWVSWNFVSNTIDDARNWYAQAVKLLIRKSLFGALLTSPLFP